jgi:hypothetical protein
VVTSIPTRKLVEAVQRMLISKNGDRPISEPENRRKAKRLASYDLSHVGKYAYKFANGQHKFANPSYVFEILEESTHLSAN